MISHDTNAQWAHRIVTLILTSALGGCGSHDGAETRSQGNPGVVSSCDPRAVDRNGHFGACAAGTSGPGGPGVPIDFTGKIETSMAISATEQAAIERANALAAARHPPSVSPIDRGFGSPPALTYGRRGQQ